MQFFFEFRFPLDWSENNVKQNKFTAMAFHFLAKQWTSIIKEMENVFQQ